MRLDEFSAPWNIDGVFDHVERTRFVSFGFDLIRWSSDSFGPPEIIRSKGLQISDIVHSKDGVKPKIVGK